MGSVSHSFVEMLNVQLGVAVASEYNGWLSGDRAQLR